MALIFEDPEAALSRWKWTQKVRTIKGQPWSFEDREYLEDIYEDECPVVVVKKARQLEMTEFLVNMMGYYACERPNTTIIFASPRSDQVKRVSKDRMAKAIKGSEYMYEQIHSKEIAVESMRFKNGSIIYFVSAWGDGDAARGIDADILFVDEVQDVTQGAIEAMREGMSHSTLKKMFLIGSPKLAGSEFDLGMWRLSDQKQWSVEEQRWIAHPPESGPCLYSGYHMFQGMAPWITAEEIEDKRLSYSEMKFVNEVMGEFYAGGAVKLTIEQLYACGDRELQFDFATYQAPAIHYAGIDWGDRSYMVIMDHAGVIKRVEFWDDRADVSLVEKLMVQYNVRYLVADMGYGKSEVSKLQNKFGHKVWGCQYVDQQAVEFKKTCFKTPDGDEDMTKPVVNADRTSAMDLVYERVYNGGYTFPMHKSATPITEWVFQHMLAPFEEIVKTGAGKLVSKKRYARSGADHTFHCLVYATIAAMMGGGGLGFATNIKEEGDGRFTHKEYWVQDSEMDSWYDHNAMGPDA